MDANDCDVQAFATIYTGVFVPDNTVVGESSIVCGAGAKTLKTFSLEELAAGATGSKLSVTKSLKKYHYCIAQVDSASSITEADEENNQAKKAIKIK